MAISSLILAIFAIVIYLVAILECISIPAVLLVIAIIVISITGLILGIISLKRHKPGRGIAITGIVLNSLVLLFLFFDGYVSDFDVGY
jgi:hypothetical protein